jgi:hypothetical protein
MPSTLACPFCSCFGVIRGLTTIITLNKRENANPKASERQQIQAVKPSARMDSNPYPGLVMVEVEGIYLDLGLQLG